MTSSSDMSQGAKIVGFLLAGLAILFNILFHDTGGISGFVRVAGIIACIWCLQSPKTGLYILGFFCFYLDFVKKLAVAYGAVSMMTVMEVLAIQMLALGCIVAGTIIKVTIIERRMEKSHLVALFFGLFVSGVLLALNMSNGTISAIQSAVNNGGYACLILVILAFMHGRGEMIKYLDYLFWLAVPWALYGIWQFFNGFFEFEWVYARTWLSPVSSLNMFAPDGARPCGFASGPQGYGVLTQLMNYGLWRFFTTQKSKLWLGIGCAIILAGLITSLQRTPLLQPILFTFFYLAYKNSFRTKALYLIGGASLFTAICFSSLLLANLESTTNSIKTDGSWGSRVLNVNSFADRLMGWERLTRLSTYTLIGKRWSMSNYEEMRSTSEEYSHDMVNNLLDNMGVLGLLVALSIPLYALGRTHRAIWQLNDPADRSFATCMMATVVIQFTMATFAGSNLGVTPHNVVNWTMVGAIVLTISRGATVVAAQQSLLPAAGRLVEIPRKQRVPFRRSGRPMNG